MEVKFKRLTPSAKTPLQATEGAAGLDLYATDCKIDIDGGSIVYTYGTGIAVKIPEGHVGLLFPRSSCYATGLVMSNCVGVIDSDYRGEIKAKYYLHSQSGDRAYEAGERIAQLVIVPIPFITLSEVDELTDTKRGTGGYGSTGRR